MVDLLPISEVSEAIDAIMSVDFALGWHERSGRGIQLGADDWVVKAEQLSALAYVRALKTLARVRERMAQAFEAVDVILLASSTSTAATHEEESAADERGWRPARLNHLASLSGCPGLTVPINVGCSEDQLPVGVQVIAPWNEEGRLFDVGRAIEYELGDCVQHWGIEVGSSN
jgi:aspartyl-tRNA(Asn)/glutamyl-tRNA(Gln) amidotransferase subunit A